MDMHKYKNAMFLGRQQVGVQLQVVESGLSDCNLFLSTLLLACFARPNELQQQQLVLKQLPNNWILTVGWMMTSL